MAVVCVAATGSAASRSGCTRLRTAPRRRPPGYSCEPGAAATRAVRSQYARSAAREPDLLAIPAAGGEHSGHEDGRSRRAHAPRGSAVVAYPACRRPAPGQPGADRRRQRPAPISRGRPGGSVPGRATKTERSPHVREHQGLQRILRERHRGRQAVLRRDPRAGGHRGQRHADPAPGRRPAGTWSIPSTTTSRRRSRSSTSRSTTSTRRSTNCRARGQFEKYEGSPSPDEKGIVRGGGPLIAWFTDPAGNILSVLQER